MLTVRELADQAKVKLLQFVRFFIIKLPMGRRDAIMGNYIDHLRYKAHKDLTGRQVEVLTAAFAQINSNMPILRDYYAMERHKIGRDGKCMVKRLTGENKLKIRIKEGMKPIARVIPVVTLNTNRITINAGYLQACFNSWHEAASSEEKDCALCELAGTIVHEASHTCLGNEKYAYLVEYYYRWRYRSDNGYTCPMCSASTEPPSWYPQDYKNKDEILRHVTWCGFKFVEIPLPANAPVAPIGTPKIGNWYLDC